MSNEVQEIAGLKIKDAKAREEINKIMTNHPYVISDFKTSNDTDYTNAWNLIMNKIKENNGGTIIIPAGLNITGEFVISHKNVTVTGGGTICSTLTINYQDDENSNITINNISFNTGSNNCINIINGFGINITNCNLKSENYGIYSYVEEPLFAQQIRQLRIVNNNFYCATSVYIWADTGNYYSADVLIHNNNMNNTLNNIVMKKNDGTTITGNNMFLSRGTSTKERNINIEGGSYSVIANNELFESGKEGIRITGSAFTKISSNNIIWSGQYEVSDGIYLEGTDISYFSVVGNTIQQPTGNNIRISGANYSTINDNTLLHPGNSDHWKSDETFPSDTKYCIRDGGSCVSAVGNFCTTECYIPNNANGLIMHLEGYGKPKISDKLVNLKAVQVNKSEAFKYDYATPVFIIASEQINLTMEQFLGNATQPKLIYVITYSGTLTVGGNTIVPAQSQALFLLYGNSYRKIS